MQRRRSGGAHPTGEKQNQPFQFSFNASLKVDFQGSRITSDGGLVLVRELDERPGFGELIAQHLTDSEVPWKAWNWLTRGGMDALRENGHVSLAPEGAAGGILALTERPKRK
jgi:Transposase DDE domain group 1